MSGSTRIRFAALILGSALLSTSVAAVEPPTPTPTAMFPPCEVTSVPTAAPPGTAVAVGGTCYPLHSGRPGYVFFDETFVAEVRGDTPGNFSTGFVIPAGIAIGAHLFSVRSSPEGGLAYGTFTFQVLPFCRGDCDGNGAVKVNELVLGVNIALGRRPLEACPSLDIDGSATIDVDEIVRAVSDAETGCLTPFTPTPTPQPVQSLAPE